jgi:hypothetical protein
MARAFLLHDLLGLLEHSGDELHAEVLRLMRRAFNDVGRPA